MEHAKSPLFSLAVIALFGMAGFYLLSARGETPRSLLANPNWVLPTVATTTRSTPGVAGTISNPDEPPEGYVKYENERYGFSYYHSPQSSITEYDEGGGAMTVVQENLEKVRGLQIFIVPYGETIITEERFKKDIPSGVRYNIEETQLGKPGISAVTFNSYDQLLGETRELWFIYKGHLYEITTFNGFGDWFAPIMQTWRFVN